MVHCRFQQINQYAQGHTPTRVESFTDHYCRYRRKRDSSGDQCHGSGNQRRASDILSDITAAAVSAGAVVARTPKVAKATKAKKAAATAAPASAHSGLARPQSLFLPRVPTLVEEGQVAPSLLDSSMFDHQVSGWLTAKALGLCGLWFGGLLSSLMS